MLGQELLVGEQVVGGRVGDDALLAANRLELPFGFFPERAFDD